MQSTIALVRVPAKHKQQARYLCVAEGTVRLLGSRVPVFERNALDVPVAAQLELGKFRAKVNDVQHTFRVVLARAQPNQELPVMTEKELIADLEADKKTKSVSQKVLKELMRV